MKKIIILEHINFPSDQDFRYCLWADVPTARQPYYATPTFVSAYKDATAEELTALRSGAVVEQVGVIPRQAGATLAQIRTDLIGRFTVFQNSITNYNPYDRYGTSWDGTSWTTGGVA